MTAASAVTLNINRTPLALWSLISNGDDQLTYAIGSAADNRKYRDMPCIIYDNRSIDDDTANRQSQKVRQKG